jgi:hypothetical protein
MKCNLIIPGFGKCGTSSLHQYLGLHPNICMSTEKEPHYFSQTETYKKGELFHDQLFSPEQDSKIIYYGESSTSYCYDETALRRIRSDIENPRIVILLREPVERLLSHYRWLWALGLEDRPLLQAVMEEEVRGYDVEHPYKNSCNYATYLRGSRYSVYVPLMEQLFGAQRVFCLRSELLQKNPQECLNSCFYFLALDSCAVGSEINVNATRDKRIPRTLGLRRVTQAMPRVFNYIDPPHQWRNQIKSALGSTTRRPPKISDHDLKEVSVMLKDDVKYYRNRFELK